MSTAWNPLRCCSQALGFAAAPGSEAPGAFLAQLGISTRDYAHGWFGDPYTDHYRLPVSIPPGQTRVLRLMWTTDIPEVSGEGGIDRLILSVRVGLITRNETVSLGQAWFLAGPDTHPAKPKAR